MTEESKEFNMKMVPPRVNYMAYIVPSFCINKLTLPKNHSFLALKRKLFDKGTVEIIFGAFSKKGIYKKPV
jgi:hypothetical protein